MTELQCGVENCTYNTRLLCCLPQIEVGGPCACGSDQTYCSSFVDSKEAASNATAYDQPNPTLDVRCNAKNCVHYEENDRCSAESIEVNLCAPNSTMQGEGQTMCNTFRMK